MVCHISQQKERCLGICQGTAFPQYCLAGTLCSSGSSYAFLQGEEHGREKRNHDDGGEHRQPGHVLSHFMSCKYPLSIVVMELAAQLKIAGLELNLGWVPRGQNVESDALTNSEFEGFDPEKRIQVKFEDLEFVVLGQLMDKAASLDEEIKLAKTSKEAKGDRPRDTLPKKKRGQTRWEDPW